MKTEVYSWRVSRELKSELEREARLRKTPLASILDMATRDWLKKRGAHTDDERQRTLQAQAAACIGAFAGPTSRRSETARKAIKERLRRRHAR